MSDPKTDPTKLTEAEMDAFRERIHQAITDLPLSQVQIVDLGQIRERFSHVLDEIEEAFMVEDEFEANLVGHEIRFIFVEGSAVASENMFAMLSLGNTVGDHPVKCVSTEDYLNMEGVFVLFSETETLGALQLSIQADGIVDRIRELAAVDCIDDDMDGSVKFLMQAE